MYIKKKEDRITRTGFCLILKYYIFKYVYGHKMYIRVDNLNTITIYRYKIYKIIFIFNPSDVFKKNISNFKSELLKVK